MFANMKLLPKIFWCTSQVNWSANECFYCPGHLESRRTSAQTTHTGGWTWKRRRQSAHMQRHARERACVFSHIGPGIPSPQPGREKWFSQLPPWWMRLFAAIKPGAARKEIWGTWSWGTSEAGHLGDTSRGTSFISAVAKTDKSLFLMVAPSSGAGDRASAATVMTTHPYDWITGLEDDELRLTAGPPYLPAPDSDKPYSLFKKSWLGTVWIFTDYQ